MGGGCEQAGLGMQHVAVDIQRAGEDGRSVDAGRFPDGVHVAHDVGGGGNVALFVSLSRRRGRQKGRDRIVNAFEVDVEGDLDILAADGVHVLAEAIIAGH